MLKQSLFYLALSLIVILFASYAKFVLVYATLLYAYIDSALTPVFSQGLIGEALKDMLTLVITPLIITGVPALIYWAIKRKQMPYFLELTWLLWLVFAMSIYLSQ